MSKPPRFFISLSQVQGNHIVVTDEDVRHITSVLRMKTGDELLLCDGQGTDYRVRIIDAGKKEVRTEILGSTRRELTEPRITLGQGLPKSDKMDWIVQKATELGVSSIVPLVTERTIVKIRDEEKRVSRWQKICREAAMQSNRPDVPRVEAIQNYSAFLESLSNPPAPPFVKGGNMMLPPLEKGEGEGFSSSGTLLLLPWEEGTEPIKNLLRSHPAAKNIVVLIGPEGGFSSSEAELAKAKGFHAVSLGPNILRTETAAVAVLSMLLYDRS